MGCFFQVSAQHQRSITEFLSQEWCVFLCHECHRKIAMVILVPLWLAWWSNISNMERGLRFVSFVSLLKWELYVLFFLSKSQKHIDHHLSRCVHAHIYTYTIIYIHKYIYRDYTTNIRFLITSDLILIPDPFHGFFLLQGIAVVAEHSEGDLALKGRGQKASSQRMVPLNPVFDQKYPLVS